MIPFESSTVRGSFRVVVLLVWSAAAAFAAASDETPPLVVVSSAELASALKSARPGTTIEVAAGQYDGFYVSDLHGRDGAPIRIQARTRLPIEARPHFRGGIHLSDVSHLELAGLVIASTPSNGLNVDDGGTFDTPSHHVTLRELMVADCGGTGNDDGIKLSGVDDFTILRCTIERWGRRGSGIDMVGCHRGTIESTTLRDREDGSAASGIQAKGGSASIVIARCRFEHAGERAVNLGGSTGLEFFRPQHAGYEAKDLVVEGCTFFGSLAPIAFVGVDGATVRFNTIVYPKKWVMRILQESRGSEFVACRGGVFCDNLVVYRETSVREIRDIGPDTAPDTFVCERNFWFCEDAPTRGLERVRSLEAKASGGSAPEFIDLDNGDTALRTNSPAQGTGATALPGS